MTEYRIKDWADNTPFNTKTFKTYSAADDFLNKYIEKNRPETIEDEKEFYDIKGEYGIYEENNNDC